MRSQENYTSISSVDVDGAFDTIPQKELLDTMESPGVSRQICRYLATWLSSRAFRVRLNTPSCRIMGPALSCFVVLRLSLSCFVFLPPALSCFVLLRLALSCFVLPCPPLSCFVFFCPSLPCFVFFCLSLSFFVILCLSLCAPAFQGWRFRKESLKPSEHSVDFRQIAGGAL